RNSSSPASSTGDQYPLVDTVNRPLSFRRYPDCGVNRQRLSSLRPTGIEIINSFNAKGQRIKGSRHLMVKTRFFPFNCFDPLILCPFALNQVFFAALVSDQQ